MADGHMDTDRDAQPVPRYFTTENDGLLEWVANPDTPPPGRVTRELTEEEYRQRLADWEAARQQRRQQVLDAERAQADADVAALVSAGIPEDVAMRLTRHPDAAQGPGQDPHPDGGE